MSKLKYTKDGRLLFTKEMKKEYTILMPMMMPIHFTFLKNILTKYGYRMKLLKTTHARIVDEGLQNVHNDTCYPALLVIGQLLDAIKRESAVLTGQHLLLRKPAEDVVHPTIYICFERH